MNRILTFFSILLLLSAVNHNLKAQANILNPADPDVIFTSTNQPPAKAWNDYKMYKWGHTARLSWNPYSYGYKSYLCSGMAFRLKFPKTYVHDVVDGKKFPLFIFFHGAGEKGTIYDNEYQLLHGGQLHAQKVNDGTFDGFLLYIQSTTGASQDYASRVSSLIDSLVKHVKVDIDRVIVGGLSNGGGATWDYLADNTRNKKIAAATPIAAAANGMITYFPNYITVPIWTSNGGKDPAPAPGIVTYLVDSFRALGGKIDQTFYPTQGHGVWNSFWSQPSYFPYLATQHKANPLVYFQRNQFCPLDPVNAKLGLNPGFYAYEWDKNGVTILGANSNNLIVSDYGTYRGRFKRTATSAWSEWSPIPVVISIKQGTVSPPIQINGMFSNVLPSIDGNTTVPLFIPNDFSAYEWRRISDNALVSSTNTYNAPVGQYKVKVTEQFGCSSIFSDPFSVTSANGINVPDKITNFTGIALTSSSINLDWNDNPTPSNNETAFEIYRSATSGSGYVLVDKIPTDVLNDVDGSLQSNTTYYYVIRAINANGASALSNEISVTTKNDIAAPTAPNNLRVISTSKSSISLAWDASTDDVGIYRYDVYVNGIKSISTSNLSATVSGLTALQTFSFYIKARDVAGNESPRSNQVSASSVSQGLNYKYYNGSFSVLPNFSTLTPYKTGNTPNIDITVRTQNDNFAFLWEGFINIPVTGSYTFETSSDDGSKLYIGTYNYNSTALVNNDGLHGTQSRTGTITLSAGSYPIAITFFEQGGGESMNVYWQSQAAGISRQLIPTSAFTDPISIPANSLPAKPSNLGVTATSYNKINVSWNDNSNNESGFEISRSTALVGTYVNIGTTAANETSFVDSIGLSAATKYWYKVRAVNQYGLSELVSILEGRWSLNNDYNDASGNNRNFTGNGTPAFNAADKKEGTHSISLNGSSQYINLPFATSGLFPANSYSTRSIALWIKPNAAAISGTNKIIYDFGGSDNGMSLRFNSGSLQAGIASGNIRSTAVLNNVTSNANWVVNGWNHVCVVYNTNNFTLYLNGVLVTTTSLSFSSVAGSTNASRIGATNSSNAFNSSATSTNYGGLIDDIIILKEPISISGILALMNESYSADTTLALPGIPTQPANLISTSKTTTTISLEFNDNSTNETAFEIYRSVTNAGNYKLLTTILGGAGATKTYTDTSLFSNTNYYYKVRSIGIGGTSNFSSELLVRTLNNIPVLSAVTNFSMRYDAQKNIVLTATDGDAETLSFSFVDPLPAFASFTNSSNGVGSIQFNPTISDQGVYTITAIVTDGNQGTASITFTITVNSNYSPVITGINNVTLAEGTTTGVALTATDQEGNSNLTWSLLSSPSFVSLTDNGNGQGNLSITPGYLNAGIYPITVTVNDGNGANESAIFTLTVTNVETAPEKWYMSIKFDGPNAASPWNNITAINTNSLQNGSGQVTPVGIEFLTNAWNTHNAGAVTGNNSGVYPDAVIKDYYWFGVFGAPETVSFNLKGLVASEKYDVTLFGSSVFTALGNNGTTVYTINGVSKPLYVDNNKQNTVTFSSISPNASGIITINMSKGAATPYGCVNAIVLEKPFDDGTVPELPTNLSANALPNGTVKLIWNDVAYNEESYIVYRSLSQSGPFTILNPGSTNKNDSIYIDNTVNSSTSYYYKIEATNINGTSGQTNIVSVLTGNKAPVLNIINDLVVKAGTNGVLNVTSSDDLGDIQTITVSGLPSFATYQNTGNGTGTISFLPSANDLGNYKNIIVKVTDNFGLSVSDTFSVSVIDNDLRSVFVNFSGPTGTIQSAPWNNFTDYPFANATASGLKDEANINTGFSVKLLQQWEGSWPLGMLTGYNNGIFPDNVIQSSIYSSTSDSKGIQIEGLNPSKRYNVVLFSSHNAGSDALVSFTIGAQTVVLNSKYNSNESVQINGLTPSASGVLLVTATKNAAAKYLNLNAIIIQEYNVGAPILRPYYLIAESILDSSKVKLTWADRSNNETGFEVYRSTSLSGVYTLVTTTAANITSYTNSNLNPNIRYYFKVRAVNAGENSNYSNIASMVLPPSIVFLNINATPDQNAPTPWNNINSFPSEGASVSNMVDNNLSNSGIEMVVTKKFSGPGFPGVAGAGIFPSIVMQSNYWNDAGQLSQVKFSNLDMRKKYRIGVFGSVVYWQYTFANYTCNGKTIQLNNNSNNSKVVYFYDLVPTDGDLIVDVRTADGSAYCFTSAFTIEAYEDVTPIEPVPFNNFDNEIRIDLTVDNGELVAARNTDNLMGKSNIANAKSNEVIDVPVKNAQLLEEKPIANINVYPNPFTSRIDVEMDNEKSSAITILLYDLNSRLVYRSKEIKQLSGRNKISVNLPAGNALLAGTYVVSIMVDGKLAKTVKLIKVN